MKVLTVLGTRPEIIRLSRLIPRLDETVEHRLVHTGQNYDVNLKDVFFTQLEVREPDYYLGVTANTFAAQVAGMFAAFDKVLAGEKPDRLLVLGDTNSGLTSLIARRMGIPVYHMEAGNRCYDERVPEEINRRVIDHASSVLLPYTENSRRNLEREGIPGERIIVTGNPINEVLIHYRDKIGASGALRSLGLAEGEYFLVTAHRAENVDDEARLRDIMTSLDAVQKEHRRPVVFSCHPRTRSTLAKYGIVSGNRDIRLLEPLGFFDFVQLERHAYCVITDSGTVQEECCLFHVPNVTIRDTTERPETIECGSNILAGVEPGRVAASVRTAVSRSRDWTPPREYLEEHVSETVLNIISGHEVPG